MRRGLLVTAFVFALALVGGAASAHFHTFLPDGPDAYGALGQKLTWTYFWGHPYEFIVFDAGLPNVYVVSPDGAKHPLKLSPKAIKDPETGKQRKGFSFAYTPEAIGDSWLVLEAPAIPIEEEGEAVQDYVKECVHVMAQKGWDRVLGLPIELVPTTCPYGLEPGFAFKARAYLNGKPLAGAYVEIEKFNGFHVGEDMLPKDRFGNENVPMITRVAKTDVNGYVVCTLDEPGWWMVSVSAESGQVEAGGKKYPRVLRGGLWVHVEKALQLRR